VTIVVKNKSKVLCVLCFYFELDWSGFHRWHSILVIFKFNNQKNTLKITLNKQQCLIRVVFGVIFWSLNLNVTKVQSNFDGHTNSGFEFIQITLPAPGCFTPQQWQTCTQKDFGTDRPTL